MKLKNSKNIINDHEKAVFQDKTPDFKVHRLMLTVKTDLEKGKATKGHLTGKNRV